MFDPRIRSSAQGGDQCSGVVSHHAKVGTGWPVGLRQRVGIESAADLRPGFPDDLVEQAAVGDVLDEDGWNLFLFDLTD